MNSQDFFIACEKAFAGLAKQYDFLIVEQKCKQMKWEWVIKNSATGILVTYEPRELYTWVLICRLLNGKIKHTVGEIKPDTTLSCFDLVDLLSLRKGDDKKQLYQSMNVAHHELSLILEQYVQDLLIYGSDVLQGNFQVFESLDTIVKKRARKAAYKKWGRKAKDLGW